MTVASQLVHSNALKIQSFLSRHQFPSHTSTTTQIYLQEVLTQRGDRTTLEAQKVQEYVNECMHNSRAELESGMLWSRSMFENLWLAFLANFILRPMNFTNHKLLVIRSIYFLMPSPSFHISSLSLLYSQGLYFYQTFCPSMLAVHVQGLL